ncbi:MAG: leucine-rich repeat protein [Abditibacteriota bacterium]|nr:leucine-rich repeat protein [Abditibacteriota bacterium]
MLYSSVVFSYDSENFFVDITPRDLIDFCLDGKINPAILDDSQLLTIISYDRKAFAQMLIKDAYKNYPNRYINKYGALVMQIDEQNANEEAQLRYNALYNKTCLVNNLYRKIHFLINHDDKIVQDDEDTIFAEWEVLENGIIIDYKEDQKTLGYGWKKIYATLNNPIKEGAIKNTHITHLLTEANCEFDTESVVNNKDLKFVLIQSEITNIDEDAFRDNPNILVYHVCGAKYYSNVHKYDLNYIEGRQLSCVDDTVSPAGILVKSAMRKSLFYYLKPYAKYYDINGVLFTKNGLQLLFYPIGKKDQSYKVPDGVTNIGNSAFRSAKNLKTVTVPASVKSIGDEAFFGTNLTLFVKKGSYAETFAKEHKIKIKNY